MPATSIFKSTPKLQLRSWKKAGKKLNFWCVNNSMRTIQLFPSFFPTLEFNSGAVPDLNVLFRRLSSFWSNFGVSFEVGFLRVKLRVVFLTLKLAPKLNQKLYKPLMLHSNFCQLWSCSSGVEKKLIPVHAFPVVPFSTFGSTSKLQLWSWPKFTSATCTKDSFFPTPKLQLRSW